jgi:uncharacterized repeat protein (TIGR03803 family)
MRNAQGNRGWAAIVTAAIVMMTTGARAASAQQKFRSVVDFTGPDGAGPEAALVQGLDGELYGTTYEGGVNNEGTVFRIKPSGQVFRLYSFCAQTNCGDGSHPVASLIQGTDGNFYGTTADGGAHAQNNDGGTVFKITPAGVLTTLYSFCAQANCADGSAPSASLLRATDGNFYGTTYSGGANSYGTVFKMTPQGTVTTLYSFGFADGTYPSGLVQAKDGGLYGTTYLGGAYD